MKKLFYVNVFLLFVIPLLAIVKDVVSNKDISLNILRFSAGELSCIAGEKHLNCIQCLYINDIKLNESIKVTEEKIKAHNGKFYKEIPSQDSITRVYTLPTPKKYDNVSYFVITYIKNMTKIIQLTGYATKEEFTFSSLKLGDNEEKVRKFFGPPTSIDDVEEIKGYAYSYEPAAEPFKITIEFINKKVYTFRFRIKSKE